MVDAPLALGPVANTQCHRWPQILRLVCLAYKDSKQPRHHLPIYRCWLSSKVFFLFHFPFRWPINNFLDRDFHGKDKVHNSMAIVPSVFFCFLFFFGGGRGFSFFTQVTRQTIQTESTDRDIRPRIWIRDEDDRRKVP